MIGYPSRQFIQKMRKGKKFLANLFPYCREILYKRFYKLWVQICSIYVPNSMAKSSVFIKALSDFWTDQCWTNRLRKASWSFAIDLARFQWRSTAETDLSSSAISKRIRCARAFQRPPVIFQSLRVQFLDASLEKRLRVPLNQYQTHLWTDPARSKRAKNLPV